MGNCCPKKSDRDPSLLTNKTTKESFSKQKLKENDSKFTYYNSEIENSANNQDDSKKVGFDDFEIIRVSIYAYIFEHPW